ncbi:MAG: hypothetical protein IGS48_17575 [Oscillatoriales cyanobacterium C42_A2020_001]|nr:hypothetical protein [Leptolyngbyaceae cyanobacterium C42_A2020_001]
MKAEYDFSKGERGKFYNCDAEFRVPIYLDEDVEQFLTQLSADKHIDVQALVNEWLRSNIRLIQSVQTVES